MRRDTGDERPEEVGEGSVLRLNRFIPHYSMVMFHTIPYAEAKRRGAIQEEILDELTSRAASLDEVDLARADRLIAERLGTN